MVAYILHILRVFHKIVYTLLITIRCVYNKVMGTAGRRPSIPPEIVAKALDLAKSGISSRKIAQRLNISRGAVENYMLKHGMRRPKFNTTTIQAVMSLVGEGVSHTEIARRMDIKE